MPMPIPIPSHTVHQIGSVNAAMTTARTKAFEWAGIVSANTLTLELAAVEIKADHVLFHMELELMMPLPANTLKHGQFLCLSWPDGWLWRIEQVRDHNAKTSCLTWRKTHLTHAQVDWHACDVDALAR